MKKKLLCIPLLIFSLSVVSAQETFKVMFYNLLRYPNETTFPNRNDDLEIILSDYLPDLFLVCELNDAAGANTILNITRSEISSDYEMATFATNTSDDNGSDSNELQNLLYYNSTKFTLEQEIIVPTDIRDFNVYKLRLNTVNQATNPVELYVVVCHLKASQGPSNELKRYEMMLELRQYLNTLPANTNVLLGGDLNIYTANENAFQVLVNSNTIPFIDPANRVGSWSNNPAFLDVFTQSTRTSSSLGGAGGGFDDRFDFIMTSQDLSNASYDLRYVSGSYSVYGNNNLSSCYNQNISSFNCGNSGSQFSSQVRGALFRFSDHLPVTVSLETDEALLSINDVAETNELLLEKTLLNNVLIFANNSLQLQGKQAVIYNSFGQKVKSFIIHTKKDSIDVSELENGLYILAVPELNITSQKFVIVH